MVESSKYWYSKEILFPENYHESRFDNKKIPFLMLKCKFVSNYDVRLNEQYGLSIVNYKLYHPSLLQMMPLLNIIKKTLWFWCWKAKTFLKKKWFKKKHWRNEKKNWSYEDTKVINTWEYNDSYVISLSYIIIYENWIWII